MDRVDPDPARSQLRGGRRRQPAQRPLAGGVGHRVVPGQGRDRAHVDDRGAPAHQRHAGLDAPQGPGDVDVGHRHRIGRGGLQQPGPPGDAGVVGQPVDPPALPVRVVRQGSPPLGVGDVEPQVHHGAVVRGHHLPQCPGRFSGQVRGQHVGAGRREHPHLGQTLTTAGACHHDHPAGQVGPRPCGMTERRLPVHGGFFPSLRTCRCAAPHRGDPSSRTPAADGCQVSTIWIAPSTLIPPPLRTDTSGRAEPSSAATDHRPCPEGIRRVDS